MIALSGNGETQLVLISQRTNSNRADREDVWRESQRATPIDNVIDVQVAHLRRKVDGAHDTKLIYTVRGVGFVLPEEQA